MTLTKKAAVVSKKGPSERVGIIFCDQKPGIQRSHGSMNTSATSACWPASTSSPKGPCAGQGSPSQPRIHRISRVSRRRLSGPGRSAVGSQLCREPQSAFRAAQIKYSMLSGYQLVIRKKDQGERGVFYGVQVGPLSRDEANQLCSQLKNAGGSCFIQGN
jgi:hypothetical protein